MTGMGKRREFPQKYKWAPNKIAPKIGKINRHISIAYPEKTQFERRILPQQRKRCPKKGWHIEQFFIAKPLKAHPHQR